MFKRLMLMVGLISFGYSANAATLRTDEQVSRAVLRRMADAFKQIPRESRRDVLQALLSVESNLSLCGYPQDLPADQKAKIHELMVKVGLRNQDCSTDADMLKVAKACCGSCKGRQVLWLKCPLQHSKTGYLLRSAFGGCSGHRLVDALDKRTT